MNSELEMKRIHKGSTGKLAQAVLIFCFTGFLLVGGGCTHHEEECAELRNLIEQKEVQQDAKVSQISGRLMELTERLVDLSSNFKNFCKEDDNA